jgi:hypothetical protein
MLRKNTHSQRHIDRSKKTRLVKLEPLLGPSVLIFAGASIASEVLKL